MIKNLEEFLKPGDVLLYSGKGPMSWWIKIKTWSNVSHVETYVGGGWSVASRDGIGVGTYKLRREGLKYVYRPEGFFDIVTALRAHSLWLGQKYDWLGLFVFYLAAKHGSPEKMFCSEHTARFANSAGLYPFGATFDCDRVSPGMFKASPKYNLIYDFSQE